MKKTKIIALVSSLAFMLVIGFTLFGANANKVEVIIAGRDIPAHKAIEAEDLQVVKKNPDEVLPGAVNDANLIIGKMPSSPIYSGEYILGSRLFASGDPSSAQNGLAVVVEKGKRAMSVQVGVPEGVSSLLRNGNRVDITYIKDRDSASAETILKNIKVVGLESQIIEGGEQGSVQYSNVTFELTPKQCNELSLASVKGHIWLSLRSVEDDADVAGNYVSESDL